MMVMTIIMRMIKIVMPTMMPGRDDDAERRQRKESRR